MTSPAADRAVALMVVAAEHPVVDNERLGAVPPAEARAGDDPRVLVEPVANVLVRRLAVRRNPGFQPLGPQRERGLVERLGLPPGDVERGRPLIHAWAKWRMGG